MDARAAYHDQLQALQDQVMVMAGMVERAMNSKKPINWDCNWQSTSPDQGEKEVNWLFALMGWSGTKSKRKYGIISGETDVNKAKNIIKRMAKKYDQQP